MRMSWGCGQEKLTLSDMSNQSGKKRDTVCFDSLRKEARSVTDVIVFGTVYNHEYKTLI